jgi:CheY-like chemotaxis protein
MRGATAPTSRPRALRSTVVVADDDPDYRYFVRFLLVPLADTVTIVGEASDGEEAMALVLRKRPDILVADLLMPLLNGIELTRRLKQALPATKIVLMTAYTEDVNRRLALIGGADAFLDKMALVTELLPAIRDLVGSSR